MVSVVGFQNEGIGKRGTDLRRIYLATLRCCPAGAQAIPVIIQIFISLMPHATSNFLKGRHRFRWLPVRKFAFFVRPLIFRRELLDVMWRISAQKSPFIVH